LIFALNPPPKNTMQDNQIIVASILLQEIHRQLFYKNGMILARLFIFLQVFLKFPQNWPFETNQQGRPSPPKPFFKKSLRQIFCKNTPDAQVNCMEKKRFASGRWGFMRTVSR
ncbi:MAG: hypothetical protein JXD22_10665, partial [Sedimentisphaerales bacterium]|nr:hypothetical protein [Sedimentisphaerales bacterium]